MTNVERMRRSLDGLSVGDGFGEKLMDGGSVAKRALPPAPWRTTDDTEMAVEICAQLSAAGRIDQNALPQQFSKRFRRRPDRGYGGGAMRLLNAIEAGRDWKKASRELFRGEGSKGNGAAMRSAPLGAFFAGDLDSALREARAASEVTHAHPDGIAGGIAVAAAAAHLGSGGAPEELLATVAECLDDGAVLRGIDAARKVTGTDPAAAARALGNGRNVLAEDTVPFCLWVASRFASDYAAALWSTAAQGGDVDTTCAIVGGLVSLTSAVPAEWLSAREPLDQT